MKPRTSALLVLVMSVHAVLAFGQDGQDPRTQQAQERREQSPELSDFMRAYEPVVSGKFVEALRLLAEFEAGHPKSAYADRVLFWKAFCHAKLENYGKAIELNRELVEKFPKSRYADDALMKIGEINEKYLRRYSEAIEAYKQVVENFPDSPAKSQAINDQAQINERRMRDFRNAAQQYGQNTIGNENLRLGQQNWYALNGSARIEFIEAHSDHDYVPLSRYYVALEQMEKGDFAGAEAALAELLKNFPDARITDLATYQLALCQIGQKKLLEAAGNFQRLVSSESTVLQKQAQRQLDGLRAGEPRAEVELDVFSGRPNPVWQLSDDELKVVKEKLKDLPAAEQAAVPPQLGYRGFVIRNVVVGTRAVVVRVHGGTITVTGKDGASAFYKDGAELEKYLLERARERGHEVQGREK